MAAPEGGNVSWPARLPAKLSCGLKSNRFIWVEVVWFKIAGRKGAVQWSMIRLGTHETQRNPASSREFRADRSLELGSLCAE